MRSIPRLSHGVAEEIGSVEVGKLADLVLWHPAFFGVKPELVLKGGFIAWSQMGDANASIPTPQPVIMRPMFGAASRRRTSLASVFGLARRTGRQRYGLRKRLAAVRGCRSVTNARPVKLNEARSREIRRSRNLHRHRDDEELRCEPASVLPLAQKGIFCSEQ